MEPKIKNFNWIQLAIVVGSILTTAAVVGGGIWYYMDKAEKAQAKSYNDSIGAMQKQIDALRTENNTTITVPNNSADTSTTGASAFDIRHVDLWALTGENTSMGSFADTIYTDLNNDKREEAVVVFRLDGTGGYRDVFIFGDAVNESNAKMMYKGTGFTHGQVSIVSGGVAINYVVTTDPINIDKPNSDMVASRQDTVLWDGSKFVTTTNML